jgi:predicted N-acetyltransferase YhbS
MIRQATPNDLPEIQVLMEAEPGFWQANWPADVLARGLDAAAGLAFVFVEQGDILGFVCGHDLGFRAYLSELIVARSHRGEGIGAQLLRRLESELTARGCRVVVSDAWKDAEPFYRKMGWTRPDVVLVRKQLGVSAGDG